MGAVDTSKEAVADPLLLRQPSLDREGPQAEPQLPAPGPRSAVLPGRGLGKGGRGGASGLAFQLQTRLAPRRAGFVPPGDQPWAARSAGTRPGDPVVSAFPQTPAAGDSLASLDLRDAYMLLMEK